MQPLTLTAMTTANPLGLGLAATWDGSVTTGTGCDGLDDFEDATIKTWIGRIDGLETEPITGALAEFDCRTSWSALAGLRQDEFERAVDRARETYGPDRIGVLVGTTTSGILETEIAYRQRRPSDGALPETFRYRQTQNLFSVSAVVRA